MSSDARFKELQRDLARLSDPSNSKIDRSGERGREAAHTGELVALNRDDIETVAQGLVVRVRRSKTDQAGRGDLIAIHRGTLPALCPVRALAAWTAFPTDAPGPLFTRIRKGGQVTSTRLSDQTASRIVKRGTAALRLADGFSGHSLRAGLATSAALAGGEVGAIMDQTRHRSADVARRYIRNAEIWRNNVTARPQRHHSS